MPTRNALPGMPARLTCQQSLPAELVGSIRWECLLGVVAAAAGMENDWPTRNWRTGAVGIRWVHQHLGGSFDFRRNRSGGVEPCGTGQRMLLRWILPYLAQSRFNKSIAMEVISLQSGSNGNCFFVQSDSVGLVFDAGISGRTADLRLRELGREIRSAQGLVISHDHRDHAQSMGIFQRKFGLPIYVTEKTLAAARRWCRLGQLHDVRHFQAGNTISFGHVKVHSIPTPHDGADGVAFVIEDGRHRLGILTDLGHPFAGLREVLQSLDGVIIESNYDDEMLEYGSYAPSLKQRIRGPGGHLSNLEAAQLIRAGSNRLRWACICHLSEENNHPQVAYETHREAVGEGLPIYVAGRYAATEIMRL